MNFAFFDLETTGTSPAFDQPLQFAAILTDERFNEIDRVDLRCRLAPHIIPSPKALTVTGLRPALLVDPALPDLYEFSQRVAEVISRWSPAIWTGYNSIRFDEEMLRQTFYQNLQSNIFATQLSGNTRFDVMSAVYAVRHRRPDLLRWPVDETGRERFNLDRLAPLNGFRDHKAHDALGDVEATIHLARIIAAGDPDLWTELLDNREKSKVQAKLDTFQPLELVTRFDGGLPQAVLGCFCGYSVKNPNQAGFFDLNEGDPAEWIDADDAKMLQALEAPKIIRSVSTNKVPALFEVRNPTDEQSFRARLIAETPRFRVRVASALAARFAEDPGAAAPPVEKQIFNGFYNYSDKVLLREFQAADWPRRYQVTGNFEDARLRQLGHRLIAFYAPDILSAAERQEYFDWRRAKWSAPQLSSTEWMTFEKAREILEELRQERDAAEDFLSEIDEFLSNLEA